jgi:hypothetical protein
MEVHEVSEKNEKGSLDQVISFLGSAIPLEPFAFFAKTLPRYLKTALHVLLKGPRFGKIDLRGKETKVPTTAAAFYVCGIALSLFLGGPILRRHGLRVDWIRFALESLYLQLLTLLVIHGAAKLARGRGTLPQTLRAYAYWVGIILPFVFVLHYSISWFVKTQAPPTLWQIRIAGQSIVLPDWRGWLVWASYGMMTLLVLLFAWRWLLQWLSDIHRIQRRRIVTSILILLVPITYLQVAVMGPYVAHALGSTAGYIRSWKELSIKDLLP